MYLFDILVGGKDMFKCEEGNRKGLKDILENNKILKLVHDCRNDWDSLLYQYSTRLYNFIDTQEGHYLYRLMMYQEISLPVSLINFLDQFVSEIDLNSKREIKALMSKDPNLWANRPLNEEQLLYASQDVKYLNEAWQLLRINLNDTNIEIVF